MKMLITICARGGSKGIPGKNIKHLNGKPLINYSIEIANKLKEIWDVNIALSTDDLNIKLIASNSGIITNYTRPSYLSTDEAGKIDAIKDLMIFEESNRGEKYDYILDLDVTSPLRTVSDIVEAFEKLINNVGALTIFSVNKASRNPYFNMVETNDSGFFSLVKCNPDGSVLSRQTAPEVYELNASFYFYRRSFFDLNLKSPITSRSLIYEMNHICFDLDHPIDFDFLEYLIVNNKIGIDL